MIRTLKNVEAGILELKEIVDELEVDGIDVEQLENDLYKIEVKASVLRDAVNKISRLS